MLILVMGTLILKKKIFRTTLVNIFNYLFLFKIRKLEPGVVKKPSQGYTAYKWCSSPAELVSKALAFYFLTF